MRLHRCFLVAAALLASLAAPPLAEAGSGEELVGAQPAISYGGAQARHICFVSGWYRMGDTVVSADPQPCTFIFAPITIVSGDEFIVKTRAEATGVATRPATLTESTSCAADGPGRWRCTLLKGAKGSSQLYVDIAYPDAAAVWSADLHVVSNASKIRRTCHDLAVQGRGTVDDIASRGVRCSRARRVARNLMLKGGVPGWDCDPLGRGHRRYRCKRRSRVVYFKLPLPPPFAAPSQARSLS